MSIDLGAYRLLGYGNTRAPAPASSLKDVRQDARAFIKQLKGAPPPPAPAPLAAALASLVQVINGLMAWLFPPAAPPAVQPAPALPQPQPPRRATRFVVSSFNILGSSHTVPGADAAGYAAGPTRIRWAAELLAQKRVDVVGFQELNPDQVVAFKQATGDTYGLYPGNALKDPMGSRNTIAWRKDTWELVKAYTVDFPSHRGNRWPSPVVRLRNKETGQEAYFTNFHNAPGFHRGGAQQVWRDQATDLQVALVNKLKRESGLPVIVTGDMNEKDTYFRRMTQEADMTAANQGPGGKPPRQMGIDWIFGSEGVSFKGYLRERGALERKVSDHGMLVSQVRIDGRDR